MNFPLETERLLMRRPVAADAEAIFRRYAADAEVTRYMAWPRHTSIEETRWFLAFSDAEWQRGPGGPLLIYSKDDGRLLGGSGLVFERQHRVVTGYIFARDAWGKGYATETLTAMVALAREMGAVRIEATCHVGHAPSWRVMEKCGFEREGLLRRHTLFPNYSPDPQDVFLYAQILRT